MRGVKRFFGFCEVVRFVEGRGYIVFFFCVFISWLVLKSRGGLRFFRVFGKKVLRCGESRGCFYLVSGICGLFVGGCVVCCRYRSERDSYSFCRRFL